MKSISTVYYGINGQGLGHLTRLMHIASAQQDLADALDIPCSISFVTSSEASDMVQGFPVFKIPSKTILRRQPDPQQWKGHLRFFISNLMATLRPDQVVMDTQPEGSFGEFALFRDYTRQRIFICRAVNPETAQTATRLAHLPLYDSILIPDEATNRERYMLPSGTVQPRFVGDIHGFSPGTAYTREAAREALGVAPSEHLYYVSAGGGGDKDAEASLSIILDALLAMDQTKILVGYGPLYRGTVRHGNPRLIPYQGAQISRYFLGLDGAFSAAGYNSYHELTAAGVPTAFYSQSKGLDRQDLRILEGEKKGTCLFLQALSRENIQQIVPRLLQFTPDGVPPYGHVGAGQAALKLMSSHSRLPQSPLLKWKDTLSLVNAWRNEWYGHPKQQEARFGPVGYWSRIYAESYLGEADWELLKEDAWQNTNASSLTPEAAAFLPIGESIAQVVSSFSDMPKNQLLKLVRSIAHTHTSPQPIYPSDITKAL